MWSDGTPFDFHFWAKHQPNNFHNEDCVHTLGFLPGHKYEWNDVNCTECHRFTCKKGKAKTLCALFTVFKVIPQLSIAHPYRANLWA